MPSPFISSIFLFTRFPPFPSDFPSLFPSFSLTVGTFTESVVYSGAFEYQNQVIFNMTFFDGRTLLSY
jgi:hypothetical protein